MRDSKTVRVWRIEHTYCSKKPGHGPKQGGREVMCHGGPEINYTMPTPDRIESTETCAMLPHMITDWLEAGNLYGATATDAGWMLVQYEIPKEECRIEGAQVIVSEYGYVNSPVDSVIIFEFPLDSDVNGD